MEMNVDLAASIEYCFEDASNIPIESFVTNDEQEEPVWTKAAVEVLLEECLKRQKEFHNSRHRRNKFFSGIRDSMMERGFVFNAKSLEKKFYNLKKHFFTICKSRESDCMSTKPITWPYHSQMMQMFAEELEIEDAPTMASLYPDVPIKHTAMRSPNVKSQRYTKVDQDSQNSKNYDSEMKYGNSDEESRWEHKTVMIFLNECCRKKQDLWDPKIRRRKIFDEIRCRLKENGYSFYQESLDRKLRNMKKQFQVIHEAFQRNTTKRNGRRQKITWPYYEKLMELYGRDLERDIRRESPYQSIELEATTMKFRPIAPKPEEPVPTSVDTSAKVRMEDNIQLEESVAVASPIDIIIQPAIDDPKPHTTAKHDDEKLKFLRQVVEFEKRRTIVAEEMLTEMIESNRIRERRLEFNRIKLEYITKRKRKKNGSTLG